MKKISGIVLIIGAFMVGCLSAVLIHMDSKMTNEKMINSRLEEMNKTYKEEMREPIIINMGMNQLVIISNETINGQTNQAMISKHLNVRLRFWTNGGKMVYAKIFNDTGKYFSFLVPTEIAKNPFSIQTSDGRGWIDLKKNNLKVSRLIGHFQFGGFLFLLPI